jgi:uncharacterized protein YqgV (UPF0045/DUF77 family)
MQTKGKAPHKYHIMRTSVEISYYPLQEEYISPIRSFIDRLNTYKEIVIQTNGMSTQVFGEYFKVMEILTKEIHKSFELPHSVFVMKVINADLQKVD